MRHCTHCGTEYAPGARFCGSCGQSVLAMPEERRVVTVLFADLVGFTALSENLDPEQVKLLVDRAFERLVRDVTAFGGRVDKIIGDAIIALFGAPVAHEDDAERAVRAGLRMQETLAAFAAEQRLDIRMRIGVNTGEVLVGVLRAGGDYTAMGDVVNTASRLQTSADPGTVLVGEATYLATHEAIAYEPQGALIARGREEPVTVYTATGTLAPPGYRRRRVRTPLVGRDHELGVLAHATALSAGTSRAEAVLLLGEAGVGKSRLAEELARLAATEYGMRVFTGRCVAYGEANPWWPVAEALRSGCGVDRDAPFEEARDRVFAAVDRVRPESADDDPASVVNGILHLMGYEGPLRGLEGSRARAEATAALLTFLEYSLRRGPLLIRLADLHWADDLVLELIETLMTQLARTPFVLVATARRQIITRWQPPSGRFNTLVVNLGPLPRAASEELLDVLTPVELDSSLRADLLDRSGGNPLYLEELVTLLDQSDGAQAVATADPIELPDTLRGLIAARIDGLTAEERQVLEDAATWGNSGSVAALRQIAQSTRGQLDIDGIVQSLMHKEVLTLDDDGDWTFRSDLVREVAYSRLTKTERMNRHRGIAKYLEQVFSTRYVDDTMADTVARHAAEAARLAREMHDERATEFASDAVEWLREAAGRAEAGASWMSACRLYSSALELVPEGPDADRLHFLVGRSKANCELWLTEEAHADGVAALAVADGLGDRAGRARALLRIGDASARLGDVDRSVRELGEALALFEDLGDTHGRAETLRLRGAVDLFRGREPLAEAPITSALDAFRELGDRRGEAWALQNLAWIAFSLGRIEEAEGRLSESAALFEDLADFGGQAWTEGLLAFVRMQQGRWSEALEIADRISHEVERRGDRWALGMMNLVRGAVWLWTGHPGRSIEAAEAAERSFREVGDPARLEQALVLQGRAAVFQGHVERGRAILADVGDSPPREEDLTRPLMYFGWSVRLLTEVQLGDPVVMLESGAFGPDGVLVAEHSGELQAAYALALLQSDRAEEGMALIERARSQASSNRYAEAVFALGLAAVGRGEEIPPVAVALSDPPATYLDRVLAHLALGLAGVPCPPLGGMDGHGAGVDDDGFARSRSELRRTEDVFTGALVDLAAAYASVAANEPNSDAAMAAADRRLAELGIAADGWRRLFARAASRGRHRPVLR